MLARSDVELANEFVLKGHSDNFFFPSKMLALHYPSRPPLHTHKGTISCNGRDQRQTQ